MNEKLQEMNFHPVFLSEKQIQNYYEGYSNSTLWPLCHYFYAYTLYKKCFLALLSAGQPTFLR